MKIPNVNAGFVVGYEYLRKGIVEPAASHEVICYMGSLDAIHWCDLVHPCETIPDNE